MNFVAWNKTKFLNAEFNLFPHYIKLENSDKIILHFVPKEKPWRYKITFTDTQIPSVYHELFKLFFSYLKLDTEITYTKKIIYSKESIFKKFSRITKNSTPLLWILYFKIKKPFYTLLKNSQGRVWANEFLNRFQIYRLSQKDPKTISASNQLISNWIKKLERLEGV